MVARLPAPVSVAYEFGPDEPTGVFPTCPDCGSEFEEVDDDTPPPNSPGEVWSLTMCRGTRNVLIHRWCRHRATLRQAQRGTTTYFDRPV